MITAELTLARLLDEHPGLVEVLADYHPHFKQLGNKLLRKVMAPRVTVAHAARIAGVPVEELLGVLRGAAGEAPPPAHPVPPIAAEPAETTPMPAALAGVPEGRQVHLDVRDDIARGQEPFARIMAAVKGLGEGQVFVLRAPFEPIPLYGVLAKRGLTHWTESLGAGDWRVWFYPAVPADAPAPSQTASPAGEQPRTIRIDVRGLEPPQPMVRVLERLDRLGAGQELEVTHDRRPLFLYPQLDERGFVHDTDEPEAGVVRIVIRRRDRTS